MVDALMQQLEFEEAEFAKLKAEIDSLKFQMDSRTFPASNNGCAQFAIDNLKPTKGER